MKLKIGFSFLSSKKAFLLFEQNKCHNLKVMSLKIRTYDIIGLDSAKT